MSIEQLEQLDDMKQAQAALVQSALETYCQGRGAEGFALLTPDLEGNYEVCFSDCDIAGTLPADLAKTALKAAQAKPLSGKSRGAKLFESLPKTCDVMAEGLAAKAGTAPFLLLLLSPTQNKADDLGRALLDHCLSLHSAYQELMETHSRLAKGINAVSDGFTLYDTEDRLVFCNDRYREIYEKSAPAITVGAKFEEILQYGLDRGQYETAVGREEEWLAERLEAHRSGTGPLEQALNNESWLLIEERVMEDGSVVGTRRDISHLKAREAELRREKALHSAVVTLALDCFLTTDEKGVITEFNRAAEETFGYSAQDAIGQRLADTIIPESYRTAHEAGMKRHRETGESKVLGKRIELEARHKEGHVFPVELTIMPVEVNGQRFFTAYLRDISERIEAERSLREARDQAEEATLAKSNFLATISHEIRTPLNGVLGTLGLLADSPLSQQQRFWVKTSRRSGEALLGLLNDVLDFEKLEAGHHDIEPVDFNLSKMLHSTCGLWQAQAQAKSLDLVFDDQLKDLKHFKGDVGRLRQMTQNYLSNAIKFTDQGGITLRASAVQLNEVKAKVLVEVIDSGRGIEDKKKVRLFTEFEQLGNHENFTTGGTGLGLAITKRLATLMGGEVGAESQIGKGSVFWFSVTLPLTSEDQVKKEKTIDIGRLSHLGQQPRILLAEDNATNQMVAKAQLERMGCSVDLAGNGLEAVAAAQGLPYDAILLDIKMPEMNGIQACKKIRKMPGTKGKTPILAVTANALEEDLSSYLNAGFDACLTKPLLRDQLFLELAKVFDPVAPPSSPTSAKEGVATAESSPHQVVKKDYAHAPLFNKEIFDGLEASVGSAIIPKLKRGFMADSKICLKAIEEALQAQDYQRVGEQAHTLKSISGTFGAERLHAAARDLESSCKEDQLAQDLLNISLTTLEVGAQTLDFFENL